MSLYLHECYKPYNTTLYHDIPQTEGKQAHETIDTHTYNKKNWITGMWLSSPTLRIYGKADLYNTKTGELVERKRLIKKIYDGQRMQVFAQYYCLREMGYPVTNISLHSLTDNTRYPLGIPTDENLQTLQNLIQKIRTYSPRFEKLNVTESKCAQCIYAPLCPGAKINKTYAESF